MQISLHAIVLRADFGRRPRLPISDRGSSTGCKVLLHAFALRKPSTGPWFTTLCLILIRVTSCACHNPHRRVPCGVRVFDLQAAVAGAAPGRSDRRSRLPGWFVSVSGDPGDAQPGGQPLLSSSSEPQTGTRPLSISLPRRATRLPWRRAAPAKHARRAPARCGGCFPDLDHPSCSVPFSGRVLGSCARPASPSITETGLSADP